MVYMAAYGYDKGNPSNIFQGIDQNLKVCGNANYVSAGGVSYAKYPYLYFTNPLSVSTLTSMRACVDSCPFWSGSAVAQVNCPNQADCTFTVTYNSDGASTTSSATSSDIIGYPSSAMLGRVCVPSSTMITVVFAQVQATLTSMLNSSDLTNFISDVQNVTFT
jgi:hypothetical protein